MADTPITDPQSASPTGAASVPSVPDNPVGGQDDNQRILNRQTPSGVSRGIQQFGVDTLYADSGNNQIIAADEASPSPIPRVLMGNQTNFGEGLYVSKTGIDVTTAKSAADLIFNSNQDTLKIVKKDRVSFSIDSNSLNTLTIPHNLHFIPIPLVYFNGVNVTGITGQELDIPLPTWTAANIDTTNHVIKFQTWYTAYVDSVNLYIQCLNSQGIALGTFDFTYYLLQESTVA